MADYLYYTASAMDVSSSVNMEDLLSCAVCCEAYHETHRQPVLLPRCGHSFCRPCISFLVKKGCIVCPSCRTDQRVEGADNLPTEFSLLAISLAQQVTKQETCQSHGVKLSFWCKTCNLPACGECLFEDHPMTSHLVIKSTAYVNEMKECVSDITNKFMEALDGREKSFFEKIFNCTKIINDALRTITVLRKDMEEARDLMKGVKMVEGIASTQTLSEAAKFLGLKWNLQDVNLNLGPVTASVEDAKVGTETETKETEPEPSKGDEIGDTESVTECSGKKDEEGSENGANEKEKADDEKEKDVDEEENLTEEEMRKRRRIQRLKEKLAAATAAAEQAKLESNEKTGSKKEKLEINKEKKAESDIKDGKSSSQETYNPGTKNLKPWQRRSKPWEPTPREPSITPEKEIKPKDKSKATKQDSEENTNDTSKDNNEEESKVTDNDKLSGVQSTDDITKTEASPDSNKETSTATSSKNNSTTDLRESSSLPTKENDSKTEDKPEIKKEVPISAIKKPRGRLARNALKRAQTMDLAKRTEESDNKDAESENIKGLDLETHIANKSSEEQQDETKEMEGKASGETTEIKEEPKGDQTVEVKKEEAEAAKPNNGMFEMEPEEKERIATELMQVPSLTVCIEGIGGLLARVAWESMGLHIYCHQFQELPYDVIIKSNVLHALIPTKDPMVFFDISTEDQNLGRVYINLWGHLRRANNFLLLCLGDRGRSFKLSRLFAVLNEDNPGERLHGGDYEYNDGRGGEGLIDDLEYQGQYSMPMEMGMLTSASSGSRAIDSQFYICTEEDLNRQFACPFGRVVVGLPILKEAVWLVMTQQIYIQDCGVVLDCPRI